MGLGVDVLARAAAIAGRAPLPLISRGEVLGWAGAGSFRRRRPGEKICGWWSFDDMVAEISSGKHFSQLWTKTVRVTTLTAGRWYDLWCLDGIPDAGTYGSGTKQWDDTLGGIQHNGNKSTDTKHLLWTSVTDIPSADITEVCLFILYDRVLTYEANAYSTTSPQSLSNVLTAQRYVSAGDRGMQVLPSLQVAPSTASSTTTTVVYTDQDGNTGNSTTIIGNLSDVTPTKTTGAVSIRSDTRGTPFLHLNAGDLGARKVESWTADLTDASAQICFALVRPIAVFALGDISFPAAYDFTRDLAAVERVVDGAHLALLANWKVAAQRNFLAGMIGVGWG